MKLKLIKIGESAGVIIPKSVLVEKALKVGDYINVELAPAKEDSLNYLRGRLDQVNQTVTEINNQIRKVLNAVKVP